MNPNINNKLRPVKTKPCQWCRRPTANGDECLMCESSIRWLDEQTPLKAADIHKLMSTPSTRPMPHVDKSKKRGHVPPQLKVVKTGFMRHRVIKVYDGTP